MVARAAPELPVRDEAGRAHPRFQVQQHPDVPANKLGAGNALYEADGSPARFREILQLAVNRDPIVRIEDPVIALPPFEQPPLQPLPQRPDPSACLLPHTYIVGRVSVGYILRGVEDEVGGGRNLFRVEFGESRREKQFPESIDAGVARAAG